MEELQSTEILDREILEDARKKAARILKTAEIAISTQNNQWELKIAESIKKLEKKYAEDKKAEAERVMARLPVDKLRIKIGKIEGMLQSAVENWYKSLDRAQILELLRRELSNCNEQITENSEHRIKNTFKTAKIYGLDRQEAETILKNVNLNCDIGEIHSDSSFPSIVIDADDVRITVSLEKMIEFLLEEKRAELVTALVGRDFGGNE